MCADPITMGIAALSGYMQYQQVGAQAEAQQSAYNAQAAADEQNAKVEGKKQEQIADNYADKAKQINARMRIARGAQAAAAGAGGVDMSSGSSLDILSGTYENYNADKMSLLSNQRNDNFNSRVTESNFINSASANRTAGKNVRAQAKASQFATILGTATSMYGLSKDWAKTKTTASAFNYTPTWGEKTAQNQYAMGLDYDFNKQGFQYKKQYKW